MAERLNKKKIIIEAESITEDMWNWFEYYIKDSEKTKIMGESIKINKITIEKR